MSGDVIMSARDKFKSGILDFDRVVLFTPDPPPGEECFTIAKISDIKNFPAGITNEAYIGQNGRVTRHELKWIGGAESTSFIFGRVELGKFPNVSKMHT